MSNQFLINRIKKDINLSKVTLCGSGSSALFHLLKSLNLKPTDEIVLSSFNCEKILVAIKLLKLPYKFVDISLETLSPTLENYKKTVSGKTKVIIHPHLWGYVSSDFVKTVNWCKKNNIILIEDIASSYSLSFKNKKLGSYGDYCFGSFNHTKPLDLGTGGFYSSFSANQTKKDLTSPIAFQIINTTFYNKTIKFLRKVNSKLLLQLFIDSVCFFTFLTKETTSFSKERILDGIKNLETNRKNSKKIGLKLKNIPGLLKPNNDEQYSPRVLVLTNKKNQVIRDRERIGLWLGIDFSHPLYWFSKQNQKLPNTKTAAKKSVQIITDSKNTTLEKTVVYLENL